MSGLDQPPTGRAVIQDIISIQDGRIDSYVDRQGVQSTLTAARVGKRSTERWLGFFLVGAYQEILGDLHNLFGDTDSVDAALGDDGEWVLSNLQAGDTVADVLAYVNFDARVLKQKLTEQLITSGFSTQEQAKFAASLSEGLDGYTYLE